MIFLLTGAPGCGKTLKTMEEVTKLAQETGRPVYYSHIPAVTLPWTPIGEPDAWFDDKKIPQPLKNRDAYHELPQGSIIVIDEGWAQFPNRAAGSLKPSYIEAFATHRHRGHDFFLLGQNPGQFDQFVRGMVGRHQHLERQFGLPSARVWSWESKTGNPTDYFSREASTKSTFIFPKKFYNTYKSADVHVVQKRMPVWRLAGIAALCVLAATLIYLAIHRKDHSKPSESEGKTQPADSGTAPATSPKHGPQLSAQQYADRFRERVVGWQYSASFYDEKVKAATFPKISGCMLIQTDKYNKCSCNTQQGTTLTDVGYDQCVYYVHNGWFDFSKPDADPSSGSAETKMVASSLPAVPAATPSTAAATVGPGSAAAGLPALPSF